MSFYALPKEIRLQIWALIYFNEPPRLVAIQSKPHPERSWPQSCPAFSPSPAPLAINICHESRAEARYQAKKAGHLIASSTETEIDLQSKTPVTRCYEIYFQIGKDTPYIPDPDFVPSQQEETGKRVNRCGRCTIAPSAPILWSIAQRSGKNLFPIVILEMNINSGPAHHYRIGQQLSLFPPMSRIICVAQGILNMPKSQQGAAVHQMRAVIVSFRRFWSQRMAHSMGGSTTSMALPSPDVDLAIVKRGKVEVVEPSVWLEWVVDGETEERKVESRSWIYRPYMRY